MIRRLWYSRWIRVETASIWRTNYRHKCLKVPPAKFQQPAAILGEARDGISHYVGDCSETPVHPCQFGTVWKRLLSCWTYCIVGFPGTRFVRREVNVGSVGRLFIFSCVFWSRRREGRSSIRAWPKVCPPSRLTPAVKWTPPRSPAGEWPWYWVDLPADPRT